MRRTRSRQVGRSVVSGARTPNRNGLAPRVAVVSAIVAVLSFRPGSSAGFLHHLRTRPAVSTAQAESFGHRVDSGGRVRGGGEWRTIFAGPCRSAGTSGSVRLLDGGGGRDGCSQRCGSRSSRSRRPGSATIVTNGNTYE